MDRFKARLESIKTEGPKVRTYVFVPVSKKIPDFLPGQFVFLYAKIEGREIRRAYSIASSPLDKNIELTLESVEDGLMTTFLEKNAEPGDIFELSYPTGKFSFDEALPNKVMMIAGGSGITPMRSIIKYCSQKKLDTRLVLLYSARSTQELIFKDELDELEKNNPNLTVFYTVTRDRTWKGYTKRIDKDIISKHAGSCKDCVFFLCGPLKMVKSMVNYLKDLGVDRKKIKLDLWGH